MKAVNSFVLVVIGLGIAAGLGWLVWPAQEDAATDQESFGQLRVAGDAREDPEVTASLTPPPIVFVGPRENIPEDAPTAYGFWSFAMPVPGVLSRSGQPLIGEFEWLREQGWRSVVDLRTDGERDEVGDDAKLPGFDELGFNYKYMPIIDGHPPTQAQAEEFLTWVTSPDNQPAHVHCRGGIGRAGTLVALYRYAVQGWPMEDAIQESRAFQGGVSTLQEPWLLEWAENHEPGSFSQ